MGQYHYTVNLDKKEYLYPHELGNGLKLWEQAASSRGGVGSALIVLLAASNGRGGGDFAGDNHDSPIGRIVGRWAGDRIAIVGDYAEPEDLDLSHRAETIYSRCASDGDYTNITSYVRSVLERELGLKYGGEGWLTVEEKGA